MAIDENEKDDQWTCDTPDFLRTMWQLPDLYFVIPLPENSLGPC